MVGATKAVARLKVSSTVEHSAAFFCLRHSFSFAPTLVERGLCESRLARSLMRRLPPRFTAAMLRSWLQHGRIAGRKAGYGAVLLAGCAAALSLVLAASHFPRCRAGRRASKKREREGERERDGDEEQLDPANHRRRSRCTIFVPVAYLHPLQNRRPSLQSQRR